MKGKLFVILVIGVIFLLGCSQTSKKLVDIQKEVKENSDKELKSAMNDSSNKKIFEITGENFKFIVDGKENPDIRVKEGDIVRIELKSILGVHDWTVDELSAATQKISAGNSAEIEFVADKKGSFKYYCSVGDHRQAGMEGNFIVE
ncbi:MAG: multicopper oxidase domain-containing protein [Nanoarchaeota archaeon]